MRHIERMAKTRGRPTEYNPKMIEILDAYEGAGTIQQIADLLSIGRSTVYDFMNDHEIFSDAVLRVRARADEQVESAMHKRSLGYSIPNPTTTTEETVRMVKASDLYDMETLVDMGLNPDEEVEVEAIDRKTRTVEQHTHIPASEAAGKFWLSNRKRKDWTERKTVEVESTSWGALIEKFLEDNGDGDDA